jgi:hypothetical protein
MKWQIVQIIGRLKPEIRGKRRGQLSNCIVFCMTITVLVLLPHTVETLHKLNFVVLTHPPYSYNLAPFGLSSLWSTQGGVKEAADSPSDQQLKEAVDEWLAAQQKTFFF